MSEEQPDGEQEPQEPQEPADETWDPTWPPKWGEPISEERQRELRSLS